MTMTKKKRSKLPLLMVPALLVNGMGQPAFAADAAVQAENMKQLQIGIEEIARGIQDNSAASQETSATSEELASQAEILNQMVKKFELC